MNVAIYDIKNENCICLVMSDSIESVTSTVARYEGDRYVNRILDNTPFAETMTLLALPTLTELDNEIVLSGATVYQLDPNE